MAKSKPKYSQDQLSSLLSFWEIQKIKGNVEAARQIEEIKREFAKL
jgi:hypothetical protein